MILFTSSFLATLMMLAASLVALSDARHLFVQPQGTRGGHCPMGVECFATLERALERATEKDSVVLMGPSYKAVRVTPAMEGRVVRVRAYHPTNDAHVKRHVRWEHAVGADEHHTVELIRPAATSATDSGITLIAEPNVRVSVVTDGAHRLITSGGNTSPSPMASVRAQQRRRMLDQRRVRMMRPMKPAGAVSVKGEHDYLYEDTAPWYINPYCEHSHLTPTPKIPHNPTTLWPVAVGAGFIVAIVAWVLLVIGAPRHVEMTMPVVDRSRIADNPLAPALEDGASSIRRPHTTLYAGGARANVAQSPYSDGPQSTSTRYRNNARRPLRF